MKATTKKIIVGLFILLVLIFMAVFLLFKSTVSKPLTISDNDIITVEEGDSFYSIINRLSVDKKIKSPIMIKIYTKLTGMNLEVVPGKHALEKNMSLNEFIETLRSASNLNTINLTIPEGFNIDGIAMRVEEKGICTAEEFITTIRNYPLPSYVKDNPEKRYNLEGFLFPDTYNFDIEVKPEYIIETMISRFEEVWKEITQNEDINSEEVERIVNIASVIEKEARVDEDRPLIASVIYNRINKNMPLQIDATVIYAHGYHIESVRERHLAIESRYNTYLYTGLPVGPICNPGVPSMIAAMNPAETDYLFYLLSTDKEHYFTNNYEDFLKKKNELGY